VKIEISPLLDSPQGPREVIKMELPDHYPLAKASDEEALSWADASEPHYRRIREAAPWLKTDDQVRSYCEGLREGLASPGLGSLFGLALQEVRNRF
jgi:hypothetical protein